MIQPEELALDPHGNLCKVTGVIENRDNELIGYLVTYSNDLHGWYGLDQLKPLVNHQYEINKEIF